MITVIIPVLNAMPYLPEALASLEAQTFRDFEVCLWDNGSTDGSLEEARRWIPGKLPGRVVADRPLPFHECLATMVEEAQTEFVARMDGDDVSMPDRFEWQVAAMRDDPGLGIAGGRCPLIDAGGRDLGCAHPCPLSHEEIISEMMVRSALTHPALMFRRDAVLEVGNYSRPKPVEDLDLYFRMSGICHFRNLDRVVLNYRIQPKSICQSDLEGQQRLGLEVIAHYAERVYGLGQEEYQRLRNKGFCCAAVPMLRSAGHRSGGDARRFWRIASSASFLFTARCVTRSGDWISKAVYRILGAMADENTLRGDLK
jgi:glycosyltransferase involved in cell wall biosynthesis